ncbi:MAG TPA: peptidase U62, partial [Candidatus Angelobacter sp.]|nr:peptidase U62 [Candidatus Angelobacter sp.]
MRRLIPTALLLFVSFVAARAVDSAPPSTPSISTNDHGDPVLKAMLAELKRSQEKLQLGQLQRPYYIDYQVTEIQDNTADATLGALRTDQLNTGRLVRVVVRIGDYKQDSYFGEGMGAVEVMPMDNDEMALRRQLWLATDKAYKSALSGFTEKQAALKSVETESDLADFAEEKPAQSVRDLARLDVDLGKWKQTLRTTSDLFRGDPNLETSSAMLNFRVLNRYFVNTEGTVSRSGKTIYTLLFSGSDQADDGMHLERSHGWV